MFKSKKNKVDELIKKLHRGVTEEVLSIDSENFCTVEMKGYTCTRLKGHSGYHIASAPGFFVVMWHGMVSDVKEISEILDIK